RGDGGGRRGGAELHGDVPQAARGGLPGDQPGQPRAVAVLRPDEGHRGDPPPGAARLIPNPIEANGASPTGAHAEQVSPGWGSAILFNWVRYLSPGEGAGVSTGTATCPEAGSFPCDGVSGGAGNETSQPNE